MSQRMQVKESAASLGHKHWSTQQCHR